MPFYIAALERTPFSAAAPLKLPLSTKSSVARPRIQARQILWIGIRKARAASTSRLS
jgi:hypothetical protein